MRKKQIALFLIIVLVVTLIPQNTIWIKAANRTTSEEGLNMIKEFEGFRDTAYKAVASEKYYTIGYGHYGADVYPGMTITREQGEQMLRNDIQEYEGYVNNFLNAHSISVNQNQYDALVSFTYNLGNVWVSTPTFQLKTYLINGINNYSDEQITTAFTNWCKDGAGNVLDGLLTRRRKEAAYFLGNRNGGGGGSAPQIHAWISDDKMGGVPETYKLGKMYYLCYELIDPSSGKRFENTNNEYNINETLYGSDGGVANTCDYANSNNNWIGYSTYTAGTYKGVITISGAYEGSIEVSYTIDEIRPQIRIWVSKDKMGEETNTIQKGEMFYLCYEVRDGNSEQKINERIEADYTAKEIIYKPDGNVAHTYTYESSDYNWIGYKASEPGTYKCSVTISGRWNNTYNTEVIVTAPTAAPVKTATPTVVPTRTPVKTATPTVVPTRTPVKTATPTIVPTRTPVKTVPPTIVPTRTPIKTATPTTAPTRTPIKTTNPIIVPTKTPQTMEPTIVPTETPQTIIPPTVLPTNTVSPALPTVAPTIKPIFTMEPIFIPTTEPEELELEDLEDDIENELEEGDLFEVRGVTYEVTDASEDNPTVECIGNVSNKIKTVIIPEKVTYEDVDYKVTGIAKNAFKNNKKITTVTIGRNVTYIGAYAFYGNSKLKMVKIKSQKIRSIQKKAFFGMPKKVTVKVPANVKIKYKKMLKNAGLGKR